MTDNTLTAQMDELREWIELIQQLTDLEKATVRGVAIGLHLQAPEGNT